jgi:hypothetical protein
MTVAVVVLVVAIVGPFAASYVHRRLEERE